MRKFKNLADFLLTLPFAHLLPRLTAIILLLALITPVFLLQSSEKVSASSQTVINTPTAPVSAPPEAFFVSDSSSLSNSITTAFGSFLSFSNKTISRLFEKPKVPAGLEQPENQLTLTENLSAENTNQANLLLTLPPAQTVVKYDFDGDSKADIARWHSSNTEWKVKNSSNGNFTTTTIGSSSSIIAPGDFDGDGKTDVALFNAGTWTIKKSSNSQTITVSFGTTGDKPVVGDYDGDGLADCAVFRPSTNTWWILRSSDANYTSTSFGASGDITAQGNFDGDSKTDIAVFRPSTGDWHVQGSSAGYFSFHWGIASDIPVPADFDGDGKTDFAVYRGSAGTWYVSKSSTNNANYFTQVWGNFGDQPLPADYDGDGKDDFAVWRPTTGVWHIIKSGSNPAAYDYQTLGQAGDTAISSAYLKQIGGAVAGYDLAKARLAPKNSTGGTDLYSQNFNWGTSLVGLPGRAGMDMGFGISYNSLVWTKEPESNAVYFDADNSNVSPGFRFGFPTIEPVYWDKDALRFNYLMVTPSGARVEFRQLNGASDTYETADSSYAQLKTTGATNPNDPVENISITVSGTNGSKMTYLWKAGAFRCSEIKDRNGNYITVNHNEQGLLTSVTDTLGRVVSVNYDTELYPTSITQTWKNNNGAGSDFTYTWASFTYSTTPINTSFASGLNIVGPANGTLKVLQKITFPSGAYTTFDYNDYGQVKKITNFAADWNPLNYVETNLANISTVQSDCPRFTETKNWVKYFNQDQPVIITNSITENSGYNLPDGHTGTATKIEVSMQNHPHGAVSKTFVGNSGWQESLPIATEDWANGTGGSERKRWTWANWTQDDTNLAYIQNPRVIESKVGDTINIKRSTTEYRTIPLTNIAEYGLVSAVYVYDADQTTILKKVETDYNLSSAYLSRRIIGLPSEVRTYGRENSALNLVSKASFNYDGGDFSDTSLEQNPSTIIQHDTNFGASFVTGRGNLTSTTRYDVTGQTANVTSSAKYNIAGATVAQIDPLGRTIKLGYSDSFNDNQNRNTFAYPTRLYDPSNNYSEITYRFDAGANVWAKSPAPAGNTVGKISARIFDSVGRLQKESIFKDGSEYSYTRYEYPTNQIQSKTFSIITDSNNNGVGDSSDEVLEEGWTDGAGRVLRSRTILPGSSGGYSATFVEYDILGRVKRSTVPTEVDSSWNKAGDDATRDWLWASQEYDWKGRTTRKVNSDGTDKLISYEGCGCAGGEIATTQSESVPRDDQPNINARRTQKLYQDILGRTYKAELLDWDSNVYSTILTEFNGRDQTISLKQYAGTTSSSTSQETTRTYDGHGRLKTEHLPQQETNKYTSYEYYNDDQIQSVTDARGAIKSFQYNDPRGLLTQVSFTPPPSSEALHPQISGAGRGTDGTSIWIHGSNFDTDATVIVTGREPGTQNPVSATYTGGQITTGTTSNGQQSLTFQVNSQIVQALDNNSVFVWVVNTGSTRFSNQAYQMYNGVWNVIAPFTQIQPSTPSPISFEYDALGNRTLMTDGMGTVNYYYNQLSQLTSESRHFSGSTVGNDLQSAPGGAGIFNIAYDYDLGGKLKTITDPYGQAVNYTQNQIGQTVAVTGSFFAGGYHNYASNVKYRAWGAIKSIDYVNNGGTTTESYTYNNRLLPETYKLYHASNGITSIQKQYQFYADGNPKYTKDGDPNGSGTMFDRAFKYDFAGRLTDSRTGSEARGGSIPSDLTERPYSFQRSYDIWGNATSTTRNYWADGAVAETNTYINNREVGINATTPSTKHYDSDGRILWDNYLVYGFDAAGNQTQIENVNNYKQDRWMDGENHLVREHITDFIIDENNPNGHYVPRPEVKYYIRSSLLGGDVISESWRNGTKQTTFVYGFNKVLGRQQVSQNPATQSISWEYTDSSGTSQGGSNQLQTSPLPSDRHELDPLGVDAGISAPDPNGGGGQEPWNYPRFGDPYEGDDGCTVDGVQTSCSTAYGLLGNGSAVQCPDNDCGPRTYYDHESGHSQLLYLNVQALQMGIGTTGYGPGFLPTNVGFNGSTFNIWTGTATFSLGGAQTTGQMTGEVNIFPTPENNFRLADPGLDGESDGYWSNTINSFQTSQKPTPLTGNSLKEWESERDRLLELLLYVKGGKTETKSKCVEFLEKVFGKDGVKKIIESLMNQTPYDFMNSTNPDLHGLFLTTKEEADFYVANNLPLPDAFTSPNTGDIYYTHTGLKLSVILHENLHKNFTEPSNPSQLMSDQTLAENLGAIPKGVKVFGPKNPKGSRIINDKLEAEGCK